MGAFKYKKHWTRAVVSLGSLVAWNSLFFFNLYLFGCSRSQLQHKGTFVAARSQ